MRFKKEICFPSLSFRSGDTGSAAIHGLKGKKNVGKFYFGLKNKIKIKIYSH
jgi:hypothetical protein